MRREEVFFQGLAARGDRRFDYTLPYAEIDLRENPELYRVGRSEEGVLLVQPYKNELLPCWRFRTPEEAAKSARALFRAFERYRAEGDFVGMDMARKFLQMGFTRSRRYANHAGGRKYSKAGDVLPFTLDPVKARSAEIFRKAWQAAEGDDTYAMLKQLWKLEFG